MRTQLKDLFNNDSLQAQLKACTYPIHVVTVDVDFEAALIHHAEILPDGYVEEIVEKLSFDRLFERLSRHFTFDSGVVIYQIDPSKKSARASETVMENLLEILGPTRHRVNLFDHLSQKTTHFPLVKESIREIKRLL